MLQRRYGSQAFGRQPGVWPHLSYITAQRVHHILQFKIALHLPVDLRVCLVFLCGKLRELFKIRRVFLYLRRKIVRLRLQSVDFFLNRIVFSLVFIG